MDSKKAQEDAKPEKFGPYETTGPGARGFPPASTSYPYPPGLSAEAPISYPEATAPPLDPSKGGLKGTPSTPEEPWHGVPPTQPSPSGIEGAPPPPPPPASMGEPAQNVTNGVVGSNGNVPESHPQKTKRQDPQHLVPPSQQESDPGATPDPPTVEGIMPHSTGRPVIKVEEKSLLEAYILWFPFGIIGLHQFYLGRVGMGILYFFTLGLFGIGWLTDMCRLPYLVRQVNEKRRMDAARGFILYAGPYSELTERNLCSAYLFWLPPVGLLGGHHYYLGRIGYGLAYTFTLGIFGVGWLIDSCRMWVLTKRTNDDIKTLRSGRPLSPSPADRMHLDDAYCLAFPLGFLGLHHFYMRRWGFGIIYFLTLGCMGVGFLVDLFRLPCLLERTKRELTTKEKKFHLDDAYILWFPLGFLGLHHFYLRRWFWGIAYLLTFGFCGIGWLIDLCRLPFLVQAANERTTTQLLPTHQFSQHSSTQGTDTTQGAPYGVVPAFAQTNMAVYAFPLDQKGQPVWTEGVAWNDEQHRQAFQAHYQQQPGGAATQFPPEPPPPYSQF